MSDDTESSALPVSWDEAREAVEAGLKQAPRNGPLLQLKLAIQRF